MLREPNSARDEPMAASEDRSCMLLSSLSVVDRALHKDLKSSDARDIESSGSARSSADDVCISGDESNGVCGLLCWSCSEGGPAMTVVESRSCTQELHNDAIDFRKRWLTMGISSVAFDFRERALRSDLIMLTLRTNESIFTFATTVERRPTRTV